MPECFLDTNLVEALLECANEVNHKKGNSSVITTMSEEKMRGNFAVAIIDDDKVKVKALETFEKVERLCKDGLKFYKHPERQHFVIQISPAIERWLLKESLKADVDMTTYGLGNDLNALRKMKGAIQRNDDRFKKLFKEMLKNENCDEIIELKRWLKFLKEKNYNTDLDSL